MKRENIDKIAQTPEDKILLARLWDKIYTAIQRDIPANTCFLSPREQELAQYLFGNQQGLTFFGGCERATRKMLVYLPEYMDENTLYDAPPMVCLRARFYAGDSLSHRDFLGALLGAGIARETVGDIYVAQGSCDFFVTEEIAPYLLQSFDSAGRAKLKLEQIPVTNVCIPEPEIQEIKDTLASLRLDSVSSAGFRISRSAAADFIIAGKAVLNGLTCEKPDKSVEQDAVISVRTKGKIKLVYIGPPTKKGRIPVIIHRYL